MREQRLLSHAARTGKTPAYFLGSNSKVMMIEEAHLMKSDIYDYAPNHKVSKSYMSFCNEVLLKAETS